MNRHKATCKQHKIHLFHYEKICCPLISSGSIVMAIGIFSLATLQNLPFFTLIIAKIIAMALFVLWLYLALSYLASYCNGTFNIHIKRINDQFSIGTWVAGSAVLGIVLLSYFPSWGIIIWMISILAVTMWIRYLGLVFNNLRLILIKQKKFHSGLILLSTVSTQSIVLLMNFLLPNGIPELLNQLLIILGYLLYMIGMIMIIRYYSHMYLQRLTLRWNNTNSIIHGAMSITGLASIVSHSIPSIIIVMTWIWTTYAFILVEGISIIKLYKRVKMSNLMKGAFSYDISQWSRNFTYGMYYEFTFSIYNHSLLSNSIINTVIKYGQYIVLMILLCEIFVLLNNKFFNSNMCSR